MRTATSSASSRRPVPIPPATGAAVRTAVLSAVEAASELNQGATFDALAEAYWTARKDRHRADVRQCADEVAGLLAEHAGDDGRVACRDIQAALREACGRVAGRGADTAAYLDLLAVSERRNAIVARAGAERGLTSDRDASDDDPAEVNWANAALVAFTADVIAALEAYDHTMYLCVVKTDEESCDERAAASCWWALLRGHDADDDSLLEDDSFGYAE